MRTELGRMREILRAALPEKAFLRRDRGDALFISNAPAIAPVVDPVPGFVFLVDGKLLRILPEPRWMQKWEETEPPDHLSESLIRFRGAEPEQEALVLFVRGLKLLDMGAGAPANEIDAFDRAVRQLAAAALRRGSGGGLYALAILNHQICKGE